MKIKISKKELGKEIISLIVIAFGITLMAIAFNTFFVPNEIAPGGVSGLSEMIARILNKAFNITFFTKTIVYLIINVFILIFAYKLASKKLLFNAIYGIIVYSLLLQFLNIRLDLGNDQCLAVICGAALMGIGTGIVVVAGGSTGGSDLLGIVLNKINYKITVGKVVFVVDLLVILLSILNYSVTSALYTIVAIYITTTITDKIIDGFHETKAVYIISEKYEEIAQNVLGNLYRGTTKFECEGMYTKQKRNMILCLMNKLELLQFKKTIYKIDENAFVFVTNVQEAIGNGFNQKVKMPKKIKSTKNQDDIANSIKELQDKYKENNLAGIEKLDLSEDNKEIYEKVYKPRQKKITAKSKTSAKTTKSKKTA